MQEQRREERKHNRHQRILRRTREKCRQMCWHDPKLTNQQLQAPRIQRKFKEKNHQVQPDQKIIHPGCAMPRLVIANRKHRKSVNLVTSNLTVEEFRMRAVIWKSGNSAPRTASTNPCGF